MHSRPVEVLYVEDNPHDVQLLSYTFKLIKFSPKLSVARDGVEALEILRQKNVPQPDLVLLDLNLPRKNGLEVLQEIRSDPDLKSIHVMIMTSSSASEDLSKCRELQVDDYLRKGQDLDSYTKAAERIRTFCSSLEG